ncbi:hypothetical protein QR680_010605 [Steinernema hermaphroditum]|uniref:Uncharacterized protein n=1 Tax=Steinernema hermaphroditum TaxID=289476 RepID=A0AA39MAZ8_9BILA|nr:hypothetical protein QR680_010605 [Steinernema hermaphroditum]
MVMILAALAITYCCVPLLVQLSLNLAWRFLKAPFQKPLITILLLHFIVITMADSNLNQDLQMSRYTNSTPMSNIQTDRSSLKFPTSPGRALSPDESGQRLLRVLFRSSKALPERAPRILSRRGSG